MTWTLTLIISRIRMRLNRLILGLSIGAATESREYMAPQK
jgi:hypothetical protein